jgi:hypothetical protein
LATVLSFHQKKNISVPLPKLKVARGEERGIIDCASSFLIQMCVDLVACWFQDGCGEAFGGIEDLGNKMGGETKMKLGGVNGAV